MSASADVTEEGLSVRCMGRTIAAAVALLAAASLLTGCAPGANDELRSLVDDIAPADRSTVGCEWESNWGSSANVKSYYGCSWYVSGTIARVGRPIVSRAIANGFTVYCEGGANRFEVVGAQGKKALAVEVLAHGFVSSEIVSSDNVDIPAGQVLVAIGAAQLKARAPRGNPHSRCVA
jgi:hypothetical protein